MARKLGFRWTIVTLIDTAISEVRPGNITSYAGYGAIRVRRTRSEAARHWWLGEAQPGTQHR